MNARRTAAMKVARPVVLAAALLPTPAAPTATAVAPTAAAVAPTAVAAAPIATAAAPTAAPAAPARRTLLVVLDAVPFATVERLSRAGHFAAFDPPVPLISTFPSSTSIALPGILGDLGLEQSPGYEPRFFDWQRSARRGGGPRSYFRVRFPWRDFFDWNRPGAWRNAWHSARPVRSGIREFSRAVDAFEASVDPLFTVYLATTDTAGHLFGPDGLDPLLLAVDERLRELDDRVVLLSDHGLAGGEPLVNVLPAVERALAAAGWRLRRRLSAPRDVVLTPYGLVSSFEAYCAVGEEAALASALAAVDGVAICAVAEGDRWRAIGDGWAVTIERRGDGPSTEWRWRLAGAATGGLPAELAAVDDGDGWVADEVLFAGTVDRPHPDPLHRLAASFEAVANPASVICSVERGRMFGARATERAARWTKGALRWTHGSLEREASLGFVLATDWPAPPPSALRYDQAVGILLGGSEP